MRSILTPRKWTRRTETTPSEAGHSLLVLGLGSNVGDCEARLRWAIAQLRRLIGGFAVASAYRSAAISPLAQPDFLNTVVLAGFPAAAGAAAASLGPEEILALGKALEMRAGRRPGPRFGPRTLDVDLLLCGEIRLERPELTLPHPRMRERRFVLAPLAELAPGLRLPPDGATVAELLAALDTEQKVERVAWSRPP